jgi:hypothetical protein
MARTFKPLRCQEPGFKVAERVGSPGLADSKGSLVLASKKLAGQMGKVKFKTVAGSVAANSSVNYGFCAVCFQNSVYCLRM